MNTINENRFPLSLQGYQQQQQGQPQIINQQPQIINQQSQIINQQSQVTQGTQVTQQRQSNQNNNRFPQTVIEETIEEDLGPTAVIEETIIEDARVPEQVAQDLMKLVTPGHNGSQLITTCSLVTGCAGDHHQGRHHHAHRRRAAQRILPAGSHWTTQHSVVELSQD